MQKNEFFPAASSLRLVMTFLQLSNQVMKTRKISLWPKLFSIAIVIGGVLVMAPFAEAAPKKLLVVTITKGFRHSSIPTAEKVLGELGEKSGAFTVEYAR